MGPYPCGEISYLDDLIVGEHTLTKSFKVEPLKSRSFYDTIIEIKPVNVDDRLWLKR